jgi:hypothetical protein
MGLSISANLVSLLSLAVVGLVVYIALQNAKAIFKIMVWLVLGFIGYQIVVRTDIVSSVVSYVIGLGSNLIG